MYDLIMNAVDVVLAWDLSDDGFSRAVGEQANLMAGNYFD